MLERSGGKNQSNSTCTGHPLGMFTWYPVHGTSMNFTNQLISSDNRGRASALFERWMRKPGESISGNVSGDLKGSFEPVFLSVLSFALLTALNSGLFNLRPSFGSRSHPSELIHKTAGYKIAHPCESSMCGFELKPDGIC